MYIWKKNTMPLIGRIPERNRIKEIIDDIKPAFIAVYGRRRVGKTYLIKQYFDNNFKDRKKCEKNGKKYYHY